jgi:anti-sigma factor RsiW
MTHLEQQADALVDLVDNRLGEVAAAALRQHVDACAECRAALAELETGRRAAAALGATQPVPAEFRAAISRALDQADRRVEPVGPASRPAPTLRRLAIWRSAIGIAAIVVLVIFWLRPTTEPVRVAVRDARSATASDELLTVRTTDRTVLERALNTPGRPPVRVLDLETMGYTLVGGGPHELAGRPSALYVYQGRDGTRLVCQMFVGRLTELRFTPDVRRRGAFTFRVYADGDLTLVFWQEGNLVCVLAGTMSREALVELAVAKATSG